MVDARRPARPRYERCYGGRVSGAESERYWDERARENALYFVDTQVDYDDPDTDAFWRRGDEVVDLMLDMVELSLRSDDSVVDIGCGVGRITRALAHRVGHVYGLDVSSEMLKLAREHNSDLENVEWRHGDGQGLGVLGDDSVDGCFSHVVFQHIPDPAITLNYIREMGRVLRPGGWTLFQVSTDPELHRPRMGFRPRLRAIVRPARAARSDRSWWGSAVDVGALRAATEQGGLEIERLLDEGTQFTTVLARRP
jgi:ubiquinone/menaquinone biosynthesis C-methylase UbiE